MAAPAAKAEAAFDAAQLTADSPAQPVAATAAGLTTADTPASCHAALLPPSIKLT